ncbi:uncharacterized protein LOC144287938 isoform X2 [Canis aureus]
MRKVIIKKIRFYVCLIALYNVHFKASINITSTINSRYIQSQVLFKARYSSEQIYTIKKNFIAVKFRDRNINRPFKNHFCGRKNEKSHIKIEHFSLKVALLGNTGGRVIISKLQGQRSSRILPSIELAFLLFHEDNAEELMCMLCMQWFGVTSEEY